MNYDDLETRSSDARDAAQSATLRENLAAITVAGESWLASAGRVRSTSDLPEMPILRKSDLADWQRSGPPFGCIAVKNAANIFQSPGPIYEPGGAGHDWWRMGRFLSAAGIGAADVLQNCFAYHFTPAGHMLESGARAVGATVFPAGIGQTDLQVRAAKDIGATAYAGTPDFLKIILEKADEADTQLSFDKAVVSGGALFPSLRDYYRDRGIACTQCYATADLGLIAYESAAMEGMIVDEGVIVEIVRPGTGDPVAEGEVGEVVVTSLNPDYPLIRFATGDLSAVLPGQSPCGRTNMRIKGWMGRADQATKIKGMFVRPEQVAEFVRRNGLIRARVTAGRDGEQDTMLVEVEPGGDGADQAHLATSVSEILKLRGEIRIVSPGSLPNDGKVIDDQRNYD